MRKLTDDVKHFIVTRLACYDSPKTVAMAVQEEFGIEIGRNRVYEYNPASGSYTSKKWRDIFYATRKAFLENIDEIPIAQRTYRLRKLNELFEVSLGKENDQLVTQILAQAAKEMGGAYGNRFSHEITGEGGGPVKSNITVEFVESGGE